MGQTKGRGLGAFEKTEQVTSFAEIEPGMLLACYSRRFDALNLIKVTSLDPLGLGREIFYWDYAYGDENGKCYGEQFAMWHFQFDDSLGGRPWYELHRVRLSEKAQVTHA